MTPMDLALAEAAAAGAAGEIPVGAVVSDAGGVVVAVARNDVEAGNDPTAHAEMLALRDAAARLGSRYLRDCTLTVTLEPCAMCAGAIAAYRIKTLVFAAYDPKSGAVEHGPRVFSHATTHHRPEVIAGIREQEAADLLKNFFAGLRDGQKTSLVDFFRESPLAGTELDLERDK